MIASLYLIILGYLFLNEKINIKQITFTTIIMVGILIVLYRERFSFNWGDKMILFTSLSSQIANNFR